MHLDRQREEGTNNRKKKKPLSGNSKAGMKEATKRPYPYTGSISHRYTATPRASKETANANDGKAAPSHLELDVRDLAEKGLAAIADKRKGVMERKYI